MKEMNEPAVFPENRWLFVQQELLGQRLVFHLMLDF